MFKARALCQQTGPVVDAYGHIVDASKLRKEQSNPGERSSKRGGGFFSRACWHDGVGGFRPDRQ